MNLSKLIRLSLAIILVAIMFISCAEQEIIGDGMLSPKDFTHLNILLTDAPINMEEVNIDIKKVKILTDKSEEEITLSTKSGIYNLLELQNGITTLLAESDLINVKTIFQIRLVIGEQNTVVTGGESFPLIIQEDINELLTVHCNISLAIDLKKEIILDFDADQSILNPMPNTYILRPYITIMD